MTPLHTLDAYALWLHPDAPINLVLALLDAWPGAAVLGQDTEDGLRVHHMNAAAGARLTAARAKDEPLDRTAERLHAVGALKRLPLAVDTAPILLVETLSDRKERHARLTTTWQLSKRQSEVLAWVVRGETNKGIALALDVSVSMVEQHLAALYRKAGAESRPAIVAAFWSDEPVPGF
ncbi:MAG: helix-turn-helix transcriptional regulator [Myxococcales bacterium]|nr:helix-turn-helix transcriptional regulator [Myxococcales bacterium]